jgi:phage terminase small subunit
VPILYNAKYERLAQALAEGKSQEKAYIEAGFSPKAARANAATLIKRNQSILTRRNELLSQREELQTRAIVAAAKTAQITLESHLCKLAELRDLAIAAEDYSAANTAETNRGKVMGYYVERREVGKPGDFSHLSDDELRAKREMYEAIARAKTASEAKQ